MEDGLHKDEEVMVIKTRQCGQLTVHIQGTIDHLSSKAVFLTVHDMGTNHTDFCNFVNHPSMADIKERSVFIHVDLPGQEDKAPDLPLEYVFPSMDDLGIGLVDVLDELKVDYVIGMGEGAGANILTRFGLFYPERCLGLVLIHCTATVAGIMELIRDKIIGWKLEHCGMNSLTENYLIYHKFGRTDKAAASNDQVREFLEKLRSSINPHNLKCFVETFLNRTDLSGRLVNELNTGCLLVTGRLASHLHTVHTMAAHMNRTKTTLLELDHVGDVLNEAPDKLADALQLFVQGLGKLSTLQLPSLRKQSMDGIRDPLTTLPQETYDISAERRPSLSKQR